jgi:hypothetical protein
MTPRRAVQRVRELLICVALTAYGSAAGGQGSPILPGTVTKIVDGDTIEVQLSSGPIRVRLHGEQATSGGNKLTKFLKMDPASRVARQEAAMTAKYQDALALKERSGSVTISGDKRLGVQDQTISGEKIVTAMESTPLVSTGKSGPASAALAGTVKVGATGQVLRIEFYKHGAGAGNFGQLFGHEALHAAYERPSASDLGWDTGSFQDAHQVPFNDASDNIR